MQRRSVPAWPALLAIAPLLATGCFNDAFSTVKHEGSDGPGRFSLVIEPARTDVDGSHFLLDTATGDVWRLETRDGETGEWVRVGEAPRDVRSLGPEVPAAPEEG